jgi:hypothetical protein
MYLRTSILGALASAVVLVFSIATVDAVYSGPKSIGEFRHHFPYHHPPANHRPKVHIRPSKDETDDISAEFYKGLKKANNGGTLVLPKGQTFVIGKKLDLTFLKNVEVELEGTILVCSLITTFANKSSLYDAVHEQYHLLAEQLFLPSISEIDQLLEVGRKEYQDFWQGNY